MPNYILNIFDIRDISTTAPAGFRDNGGYQFNWNVDTITISSGATAIPVDFIDNTDLFFDDDAGNDQTTNEYVTLDGVTFPAGTNLEAEYKVNLMDSLGNPYVIQFVSVNHDAWDIRGFVIQGDPPPFGEALTVTSTQDVANGQYQYATSAAPPCFALGTTVLTRAGPVPVERLRRGDELIGPGGESRRVDIVVRCLETLSQGSAPPVRIGVGALGEGLPSRPLILSAQHRVMLSFLSGAEALALGPACALRGLRGVGPLRGRSSIVWVHVVTRAHGLVMAEGVPCETFWPGDEATRLMPRALLGRVRALMGSHPRPVLPFLTAGQTRRAVAGCAGDTGFEPRRRQAASAR